MNRNQIQQTHKSPSREIQDWPTQDTKPGHILGWEGSRLGIIWGGKETFSKRHQIATPQKGPRLHPSSTVYFPPPPPPPRMYICANKDLTARAIIKEEKSNMH